MVYSDQRDGEFILAAVFLGAVGAGLMALAVFGLAAPFIESIAGWDIPRLTFFWVFLIGASASPVGGGFIVLRRWNEKVKIDLAQRRAEITPAVAPAPEPPALPEKTEVIRIVPGTNMGRPSEIVMIEQRSKRWVKWQAFGRVMLEWATLTDGQIHTDALVGDGLAFGNDRSRWVIGTNGLAQAGLALKSGNARTVPHLPIDQWRAAIDGGKLLWPDDFDPPRIYPPAPSGAVESYALRAET